MNVAALTSILVVSGLSNGGDNALPPPSLIFPEEDGMNQTAAQIWWTSSTEATAYQFQMSRDSTLFEDLARDTTVTDALYHDEIDEPDGWYHWRVRAMNDTDTSAWSEVRRFYLRFPVGADQPTLQPFTFSFLGNYPNPFGNSTFVRFQLAFPADVSFEVYNLLGQRVDRQKWARRKVGVHNVKWVSENVAPGTYVGVLRAGSESRSLLLSIVW